MDWNEPRIVQGVARYAKEANWALILDYIQDTHWPKTVWPLDGLIVLTGPDPLAAAYVLKLKAAFVAVTYADEGLLGKCSRVLTHDHACGKLAAEHLLMLGYKDFLLVTKSERSVFEARCESFKQTAAPFAKSLHIVNLDELNDSQDLTKLLRRALAKCPKPLGMFCPADVIALNSIRCAQTLGWKVPQDVAVVGVDNNNVLCDYAPVPLTSVQVNYREIGYQAAELLDRIMSGKVSHTESKVVTPVRVVARESTNAMGVTDIRLMKALLLIRSNYPSTLTASDLSKYVGLSKNQLSRIFVQHLRRSIPEEINRVRIEAAKKGLTAGQESIKEVAFACGFNSANYFNKIFKEHTGVTPLAYRRSENSDPHPV